MTKEEFDSKKEGIKKYLESVGMPYFIIFCAEEDETKDVLCNTLTAINKELFIAVMSGYFSNKKELLDDITSKLSDQ